MRKIPILIFIVLISACSTQPIVPSAQVQSSPLPVKPTATNIPASTATLEPASTATPAPTSTPLPPPRWFWAVTDHNVLAFNADGQVNTVLDTTGIQLSPNDNPPIRVSDERAVIFYGNNDNPKAFVLTSDSAIPIDLPKVHAAYPKNGWTLAAQHNPYLVFAPNGTITTPAILIDGQNAKGSLVATNVFGPTQVSYFVHFSADGKSLRFATGEELVKVHSLDLQTGTDTVIFESGNSLTTESTGELWVEGYQNRGVTGTGVPFTFTDVDANTRHYLLNDGWILTSPRDCESPCTLHAYPALDPATQLNYQLPVSLVDLDVTVRFGYLLDQQNLLVSVADKISEGYPPAYWLLSPDGTSQLLGRNNEFGSPFYFGETADSHSYVFVTGSTDRAAYTLFDLTTFQTLFTNTSSGPDPLIEITYFPEGALILDWADVGQGKYWVYSFANGTAVQVNTTGSDDEFCTAFTPDGNLLCFLPTEGVALYDLRSGTSTMLITEPVSNLSD